MFTTYRVRQAAIAAAALVVGALALTACGGSSSSGTTSTAASNTPAAATTTTGGGAASGAFAAYTTCLQQHGVTLPNFGNRRPGGGPPATGTRPANRARGGFGSGLSPAARAKFQAAQTACAKLRPAGGGFGRGGGFFGGGNNNPAFAAYRNCLTLHGVTFRRPTAGGPPPGSGTTTAKMKAALTACAALRPAGFGRRPGSTTGSGSSSGSSSG